MEKLRDRLWIWGHTAGAHNPWANAQSVMSPAEGAMYIGAKNVFMISFGGNLKPPFDKYSKGLSAMREVKYSVVGDGSSPDKGENNGDLTEVIRQSKLFKNVTGGIFDDFFSPSRMGVYTPKVLGGIRKSLNDDALDMWGVLYDHQLYQNVQEHVDQFDGVSFWTWDQKNLVNFESNYARFKELTPNKRRMLGCYIFDYPDALQMLPENIDYQMNRYKQCLENGEVEGIIFCSNTLMDTGYPAVERLKEWIEKHGDEPVPPLKKK